MSYPVLKRNRYYDEENGYEYESSERNYFQDFVDFHLPFARTQQVYRTRGIAHGLEVQGKSGDAAIFVQPGVAVDGQGRLIVLPSAGGSACAWDPANGDCIVIPIGDGGLALPIAASWPTGALLYLVIEFYELLRRDEGCGGRLEQAPKLYALPVVELDARPDLAETAIILGIITLNATHKLATLSDHDAGCTRCRRILGERLGSIELQRVAVTEGGALVAEAAGTIEPDGPTGLRIETPELHLSGDLDMDGAARVKGDLELAGLVKSPTGTVIVSSPAALRSTLTVDGNASIGKSGAPANLTVNGKADVKDTLHVVKPVTLDQSLSVGGRLDVGSSGSAANLTVNGKVDVKDTLHVVKPVTLDQGLSVGGSVSLGSPNAAITMTGTLTFKGVATFQGNIGAGTAGPKARLSVVATGAAEINGTAHSSTLRISAGTLGAPGGSELSLASIGLQANNNMSLGVRAVRSVTGSDWTSVAIGLGLDVDNTVRAGASLWLHANGSVGVGTANPGAKLEVAGQLGCAASRPRI
jgi:cytoskeletal protein CcmA (bactofilin family)